MPGSGLHSLKDCAVAVALPKVEPCVPNGAGLGAPRVLWRAMEMAEKQVPCRQGAVGCKGLLQPRVPVLGRP